MAKISELSQATGLSGSELLPVVVINNDETKENKAITASSLALAIKTLEELASIQFVEETVQKLFEERSYITLADLAIELTKKAEALHEHPQYSEANHTHDYQDLLNAPDLGEYVLATDFNNLANQFADVEANTYANTISIETILAYLDSIVVGGEGSETENGHTHSNFSVLETITLSKIAEWDSKSSNDLIINLKKYQHLVVDGDWTYAIQEALNQRGTIFIPHGEYIISSPLIVYGGTKLIGENTHPRGTIGTRLCGTFVGEHLIEIKSGTLDGELDYAEDVVIEDLTLVNWNQVNKGIYSSVVSRATLSNLYLDKFPVKGIHIEDSWVTTISKVTAIGQGSEFENCAFDLFGTSCNLSNCYAFNWKNGYKLNLFYSTVSACASDHIGSESNYGVVYDLKGYNTGLLNCGAEQCYGTLVRASERGCNVNGMSAMTHYIDKDHPLFCNYEGDKVSDSFTVNDVSVVFANFTSLNGEKIYSWKSHNSNRTDISVNRIALYQNNQSFDSRKLNVYEYRTELIGSLANLNFKNNDFLNNKHGHLETLTPFDKVKYFRVRNGSHISFRLYNANPNDFTPYNDNDIHGHLALVCRTDNAYIYDFKTFGKFEYNVYHDSDPTNAKAYSIIALHIKSDVALTNISIDVDSTEPYDVVSRWNIDESSLTAKTIVGGNKGETSLITPEQFGCIGDGVSDDSVGLTQAIQYATDNDKVLLLQQTYAHFGVTLTCGLLSTNNGGFKYLGNGVGHTMPSHQVFKGIRFESSGSDEILVHVTAPTGVTLDGCTIENSGGDGVVIESSTNMFTICNGTQIRMCGRHGVFSSDLKRATITDSHILGCTGYGVRLEGYNHGIIISNNQIFGNEQGGIYIEGEYEGMPYPQKYNGTYTRSQHCVITNNHIDHNQNDSDENSESYGVYIAHSQRANISNNLIRTSRTYGLYCERVEYGTFSLNVFWKCGVNSMYVTESCSGCILIGNTFGNGTTEKLVMEDETSHLILDRYHNKP